MIQVTDPATGAVVAQFDPSSPHDVDAAVAGCDAAQQRWRAWDVGRRGEVLRRAARILRERRQVYARLIVREMGKPLPEALAEVDKCALTCDHYADRAPAALADVLVESNAETSLISYEPAGVVLAIMPWNFPFFQVFRFAAPALAAGNGCLLKHAPNVAGCARAVEQVWRDALTPPGLFATLLIEEADAAATTQRLLDDPRVSAVTVTGSERAGASVAAAAGRALKKSVLELGGSDPFVVLDDADPALAAAQAARARFLNAGQSCICAKRFIVHDAVAEEFEAALAKAAGELVVGDPLDPATQLGPMARDDLRAALHAQVQQSVAAGARLLAGGAPIAGPGFFYPPTVLADVTPQMAVFTEETFGPVAAVTRARDEDHAVALANDTRYGLGASVWTADPGRGLAVGRRIRSGCLFVNGIVASDPRLPFGGIKRSGYGRELADAGLHEFVNIRTVWIGPADAVAPAAQA